MITLNERLQSVTPSVTLAISAKAQELRSQGIPVIGFGAGEPDFDTPDFIKQAAIAAIEQGFTKYTPASGTDELKRAICDKLKTDNQLDYQPGNIVVSCGAKHSIFNVIQALCNPGDEVIIPAPFWLSYPEMVTLAGARSVIVDAPQSQNFKITPAQLEQAITPKTRLVILNSPSNPTGAVYSKSELKALGAVLLSHPQVYVISDEIYEKIIYDVDHVSIAAVVPELFERTIVVNGHSKVYSMTGWRIGYLAAPTVLAKAVSSYQSHSTSNPCSIAQKAAVAALKADQSFIHPHVVEFKKRRDVMVEKLNAMPGISCALPEGAFYVFPCITDAKRGDSVAFSEALLKEAQVAVVPGSAFGAPEHVRLSYATSLDVIEEGLERIAQWLKS